MVLLFDLLSFPTFFFSTQHWEAWVRASITQVPQTQLESWRCLYFTYLFLSLTACQSVPEPPAGIIPRSENKEWELVFLRRVPN